MRILSPLPGSLLWPGSASYNHFTPSGFSSLAWIRILQSFHPFGVLFFGLDPLATIISPLRGSLLWPGSAFYNHFTPSGLFSLAWIRILQSFHPFGVLFFGLDPHSTIISPLRGSLLWPGSAFYTSEWSAGRRSGALDTKMPRFRTAYFFAKDGQDLIFAGNLPSP